MSETNQVDAPKWYWAISIGALLWYLFGFFVYYSSVTVTSEQLGKWVTDGTYTQDYVDYMQSIPSWATAAFAIATSSGVLASLCLLLKKKWAKLLFVVALISALIMYLQAFVLSGKASVFPGFDFVIAAFVVVIAIFLIWFSKMAAGKTWLN
jgi:hypothetical protein